MIKSIPGTFVAFSVLKRASDMVVQPTCPPILVTALSPKRTWLLAVILVLYPRAVEFEKFTPEKKAYCPIAVLLFPVVLEYNEKAPEAVLLYPVVLDRNEETPEAVFT